MTYRCKLTITDLRNRLKVDIIEAVECLHAWSKGGLIGELRRKAEELAEEILNDAGAVLQNEVGASDEEWSAWAQL